MIGFFITLMIEMVVLAIRLMIMAMVLTFRLIMWLIAAISNAIGDHQRRKATPSLPVAPHVRVPLDPDLRWGIFQRDGYACLTCGSRSDLTIDHVHAVSLGGSNDPSNLRPLCRSCNSSKGARVLSAF